MKRPEIRELIATELGPFLQKEFGMVRVGSKSELIFRATTQEDHAHATPVLLFLLTGSDFSYDLEAFFILSHLGVARELRMDMKGRKHYSLLSVLDVVLDGKLRNQTFEFNKESELLQHIEEFKQLLLTKGRPYWDYYVVIQNIEVHLNKMPLENLEYAPDPFSRALKGFVLANWIGHPDLHGLAEQYVEYLGRKNVSSSIPIDAIPQFLKLANRLIEKVEGENGLGS
jgi:hypothetical protein